MEILRLRGLQRFLVRRSLTAVGTLVVALVIIVVLVHQGMCANIDSIIVQIRQQVEQDIIDRKMTFDSPEAREAYIDEKVRQELAARGLDICK